MAAIVQVAGVVGHVSETVGIDFREQFSHLGVTAGGGVAFVSVALVAALVLGAVLDPRSRGHVLEVGGPATSPSTTSRRAQAAVTMDTTGVATALEPLMAPR